MNLEILNERKISITAVVELNGTLGKVEEIEILVLSRLGFFRQMVPN